MNSSERQQMERYIIASLLKSNSDLAYVLLADDFSNPGYRAVYNLILKKLEKDQQINAIKILEEPDLKDKDFVSLASIMDNGHTEDKNVLFEKIQTLCKESDLSFLKRKSERLIEALDKGYITSTDKAISTLSNVIDDLVLRHPKEQDTSLDSTIKSAFARIERRKKEPKIKTGIPPIDKFLYGGINLGEYVLFAARPNAGKSILSIMPAIYSSMEGIRTAICVNEMDKEETVLRMLCHLSRVDMNAIEARIPFKEGETDSMCVAMDNMTQLPMNIYENIYKTSNVEELLRTASRLRKPLQLIVVDMASRLTTDKHTRSEREQLNEVSKELFRMAGQYKCTIIGTVQIGREGDAYEEPSLKHLKETGKWEEDSDKVFMMWGDKKDQDIRYISLKKNRHGRKEKKIPLILEGRYMTFREIEDDKPGYGIDY